MHHELADFLLENRRWIAFTNSESKITEKAVTIIFSHMVRGRGTVPKKAPPNWVMRTCNVKVKAKTPSINLLLVKLRNTLELPSSRLLKALKSWNTTNKVNRMVESCSGVPPRKLVKCCPIKTTEINRPLMKIRENMLFDTMLALRWVGDRSIRLDRKSVV